MITDSAAALAKRLAPIPVAMDDPCYVYPAADWFWGKFLKYWKAHVPEAGMHYVPNGNDCEDFVAEFRGELRRARRDSDVEAGLAVGRMNVLNSVETMGVAAGLHAAVIAGLEYPGRIIKWIVFEPITSQYEHLENYRKIYPRNRIGGISF